MPRETKLRETDRRFVKFKMQRIKEEKQHGNHTTARRHATELLQYLGLDGNAEFPIEAAIALAEQEQIEETHLRIQMLRRGGSIL